MKIAWTSNPLRTVVELDDSDRWRLREALQEDHDERFSDAWLNKMHGIYEDELRGTHDGDCTCVASSCLKCNAERYMGIDTTPGLDKYMGHHIASTFGRDVTNEPTIDEAIADLADYSPVPSSPMWDGKHDLWNACMPRWRDEAARAHAWLVEYKSRLEAAQ